MYSFENQTVSPPMVIAVAVKKLGGNSTLAVEWALENLMSEGETLIILHVKQRLFTVPTPLGRLPISLVQEDAIFSYMQGIELQINEMFSTYQQLCHARKVNTKFSLIEHDDVASAIIKQISSYGINELVTGSASSNLVTRRFRSPDVPETVLKIAPNFCTVHIVPIRKLVEGGHGNVIDEMEISRLNAKTAPASNNEQNMMMEVHTLRLELNHTRSMLYAIAQQEATKVNITKANELTKEVELQVAAERENQQRRDAEIRARIESEVRKKAHKAPESKQISVQSRPKKVEMDAMPPEHFVCPILQEVMDDPHMADDGYTYEYAFIRNWLEKHNTSPITNQPIQQNILIPNNTLRSAIREWKIKSGFLYAPWARL